MDRNSKIHQRFAQEWALGHPDMVQILYEGKPWVPTRGSWKRHLCSFLGCDEIQLFESLRKIDTILPQITKPEPKKGFIYIEQKIKLYHITHVTIRLFKCRRCGAQWWDTEETRNAPPLEYPTWLEVQVPPSFVNSLQT